MFTPAPSFQEELIKRCISVKNGDATWKEVSDWAASQGQNMSPDYIRQGCRILFAAMDAGLNPTFDAQETPASDKTPVSIEADAKGTQALNYVVDGDRLAQLFAGGISHERIREYFGLSEDLEIVHVKAQNWHGAVKGGGKQMLYNIRVTLRVKTAADATIEDVLKAAEKYSSRIKPLPAVAKIIPAPDASEILHIDLADIHFGLLAYAPEVGENYDLNIAQWYTLMCTDHIVNMYKGRKFKQITLASLGDILHVDNAELTTTHGTRQDTDGRVSKMIDTALETMVNVIKKLEELNAPVHYVYLPGNHDTIIGYTLAVAISQCLKDDPNVTFDISPSLFKAIRYGNTIVGMSHGEANDKRAHTDLINRHRSEFGATKYAEVHMGHLHSEAVKDLVGGIPLYRVPAICPSSYWEKSKGYPAMGRGVMSFVYNELGGKVGIGYHLVDGIKESMMTITET